MPHLQSPAFSCPLFWPGLLLHLLSANHLQYWDSAPHLKCQPAPSSMGSLWSRLLVPPLLPCLPNTGWGALAVGSQPGGPGQECLPACSTQRLAGLRRVKRHAIKSTALTWESREPQLHTPPLHKLPKHFSMKTPSKVLLPLCRRLQGMAQLPLSAAWSSSFTTASPSASAPSQSPQAASPASPDLGYLPDSPRPLSPWFRPTSSVVVFLKHKSDCHTPAQKIFPCFSIALRSAISP